jgi:hypothetical protein
MSYREPGVIINQQKNVSLTSGVGSYLPICVIGGGALTIRKTFRLVKTVDAFTPIVDANGDYISFASIVRVGNTEKGIDYNTGTHLADYSRAAQEIAGQMVDVIKWATTGSPVVPSVGDTFYAEVEVSPGDAHFEMQIMTSKRQVIEEYGQDVVAGAINNISLAAQIALENTAMVYVKKVKKVGATPTPQELTLALEEIKGEKEPYRILLAESPSDELNLLIVNHIRQMSDPVEGGERVTILAKQHSSSNSTQVLANVGAYASALNEFRTAVIYPDKAKRTLSDGKVYTLTGQMIAIALASMKASGRPEQSYTAKQIMNFSELVGVKMTRAEKNLLAAKGVMILDQEKANFPVSVRHGVSTNMSNIQEREISVTELADYVVRVLRPVLTQYKGQNITKNLITMIEASVNSTIHDLVKRGHILDGSRIVTINQDPNQRDTIFVEVLVKVPYPCNYINVVVSYE